MRARNLKPSLFKNEILATADPLYTWVFQGLWCMADRAGRLEDRPQRIHLEINPGRAYEGTAQALDWLAVNGFIARYEAAGARVIQVLAFDKHQNPHHKEPPSKLPEPGAGPGQVRGSEPDMMTAKPEASPGQDLGEPGTSPILTVLIPDSGSLIPDSGSCTAAAPPTADVDPEWFVEFRGQYPKRSGDPNWRGALRAAHARIREGHRPEEFVDGARRYAKFLAATGKLGTEFVQQASRFLGPSKPFALPWDPPSAPSHAGPRPPPMSAVDRVRQATGVDLRLLTGAGNG